MKSCSWFGHRLGRFVVVGEKETAECSTCGREVYFLHTTSANGSKRTTTELRGERPDSWPSLDTPHPAVATPAEVTDEVRMVDDPILGRVMGWNADNSEEARFDSWAAGMGFNERERVQTLGAWLACAAQCQVRKDTQGLDDSGRLMPSNRATDEQIREWCERHDIACDGVHINAARDAFEDAQSLASPSAGAVVPEGWTGWACQFPGRLPRLYGDRVIAEVNCDTESGDRLLFVVETAAPEVARG